MTMEEQRVGEQREKGREKNWKTRRRRRRRRERGSRGWRRGRRGREESWRGVAGKPLEQARERGGVYRDETWERRKEGRAVCVAVKCESRVARVRAGVRCGYGGCNCWHDLETWLSNRVLMY